MPAGKSHTVNYQGMFVREQEGNNWLREEVERLRKERDNLVAVAGKAHHSAWCRNCQELASRPDPSRLAAWLADPNRKPANLAFTEGPERDMAYRVEMAISAALRAYEEGK